jgi:hypothetical protein
MVGNPLQSGHHHKGRRYNPARKAQVPRLRLSAQRKSVRRSAAVLRLSSYRSTKHNLDKGLHKMNPLERNNENYFAAMMKVRKVHKKDPDYASGAQAAIYLSYFSESYYADTFRDGAVRKKCQGIDITFPENFRLGLNDYADYFGQSTTEESAK